MFTNSFRFTLLLIVAVSCCASGIYAQISDKTMEVIGTFRPTLESNERIPSTPVLPPMDSIKAQNYNFNLRPINVAYPPPTLTAEKYARKDSTVQNHNGYLKLGGGYPLAYYGDVSYDYTKDKALDFGVSLRSLGINNSSKIENQRTGQTTAGLRATYYADQGFAVGANAGFDSRSVYYYGYNQINKELGEDRYSFEPQEVLQRFSNTSLGLKLFNGSRNQGDLNYEAGIDYYRLTDKYAARENGVAFNLSAVKWINKVHNLSVRLTGDLTAYRDTARQSLNNFFLNPTYTHHTDRFNLKVGANLASGDEELYVFPDVEISAVVVEGVVNAFVGANGTLNKNNLQTLSQYNPFILTRLDVRNAVESGYYGGVKGSILGAMYRAEVLYQQVDNLALFLLNDTEDPIATFRTIYDTASIFSVKGSINVPLGAGLEVSGSLSQQVYSLRNEEKPWHLPTFTVNSGVRYTTPDKKGKVQLDLFIENGVPYKNLQGETANLNGLFDLNLGADYALSKNIGAFVQINNIANNRRQRWYLYPTIGLNAVAGITARF
jgi:hypothetical protein